MKTVKSGTAIIAEPKRTAQKGEPMIEIHDTDLPITAAEKIIKEGQTNE